MEKLINKLRILQNELKLVKSLQNKRKSLIDWRWLRKWNIKTSSLMKVEIVWITPRKWTDRSWMLPVKYVIFLPNIFASSSSLNLFRLITSGRLCTLGNMTLLSVFVIILLTIRCLISSTVSAVSAQESSEKIYVIEEIRSDENQEF